MVSISFVGLIELTLHVDPGIAAEDVGIADGATEGGARSRMHG